MEEELSLDEMQEKWKGTFRSYIIGFITSILLTFTSFLSVTFEIFPPQLLIYTIAALALMQAIIQLRYFLHLGQEEKPHWETHIFYFMVLVLLIIVLGSIWIMHDLHNRMMTYMMTHERAHD
ncbi:MAG: cytochrome o ubiquinol oxidase subunit IV [Chlamydiales bacterium]